MKKRSEFTNQEIMLIKQLANDSERLERMISEHNDILNELNEKVMRVIDVSPKFGSVETDNKGKMMPETFNFDFDVSTKKILEDLKAQNEEYLRKSFPELYLLIDYSNQEINE